MLGWWPRRKHVTAGAVDAGTFREDLYFRLGAFIITVPSLRDRREDIPPLVHNFLVRAASRMKKDVSSVSADAMTALMNYRWPGNVRELEHAVERAVILANNPNIRARDLPPEITQKARARTSDRYFRLAKDVFTASVSLGRISKMSPTRP